MPIRKRPRGVGATQPLPYVQFTTNDLSRVFRATRTGVPVTGAMWWPQPTDVGALRDYTMGFPVTALYDFTHTVRNAARGFAPDVFIVAGPGASLGGAVAQSLIIEGWRGIKSKADFLALQGSVLLLVALAMEEQRAAVARRRTPSEPVHGPYMDNGRDRQNDA
jgi:hypothetical protein